jgi:hypothetical protein
LFTRVPARNIEYPGDIVVAPIRSLRPRQAAELRSKQHQRFVHQPALLQMGQQRRRWLID